MYIDLTFLLLIYVFSVIALAVSIYALWTLKEVEQMYKAAGRKKTKPSLPPITVARAKGHWD
jgi:flagellar basal body-associated protein FliL